MYKSGSFYKNGWVTGNILAVVEYIKFNMTEGRSDDVAAMWKATLNPVLERGFSLPHVWPQFAIWLLTDEKHGVIRYAKTEKQRAVIQRVADLYSCYEATTKESWDYVADCAASLVVDTTCDAVDTAFALARAAIPPDTTYALWAVAFAAIATDRATRIPVWSTHYAQLEKIEQLLRNAGIRI